LLEDLRRAQSRGEWPGANTTFCRGLWRGGSVDTDRPRDDVVPGRGRTVVRGGGISEDVAFPATMTGTVGLAFGVVGSSAVSDGGVDGASFEASADAVINSQRDPKPKTKNRKFPKISPVAIGISSGPHIKSGVGGGSPTHPKGHHSVIVIDVEYPSKWTLSSTFSERIPTRQSPSP
jgi:hypothetical protein